MSVADAMESKGMKDAGYKYINLDGIQHLQLFIQQLSSRDTE